MNVSISLPPGAPAAFSAPTLCEGFQQTVADRGPSVALRTKGDTVSITWEEYGRRVRRYAAGLSGLGVRAGEPVAILLCNRPEFNLLDTAAMHLGAVPFSMYCTSAPNAPASSDRSPTTSASSLKPRQSSPGIDLRAAISVEGLPSRRGRWPLRRW
jgi:long-chain acyl-CoA synthetase